MLLTCEQFSFFLIDIQLNRLVLYTVIYLEHFKCSNFGHNVLIYLSTGIILNVLLGDGECSDLS